MRKLTIRAIVLLFCMLSACSESSDELQSVSKAFTLLPSSHTQVNFINKVENQKDFNILTFRNYYNGGGVGIGDINNDGLNDLYFTANMASNKLYLNKGDLKFEEITDKSRTGGNKYWSTGVTFVDINADGWLDIYVCNSGDIEGKNRENELFINNRDLTFTESAAKYGLNDNGYSTHTSFFDYDLDGDLDCFVLNNSYTDPNRIATEASRERNNYGAPGGDRLFQNNDNVFTDVTDKAGIYSGDIDFGLGISVGDLNNDGYPDLYVSNDFWERDYLYLNQTDGTFNEVLPDHMDYISANSMGADIADINNDGYQDIFSTDMLPASNYRMKSALKIEEYYLEDLKWRNSYFFQYIQNCLQVNKGDGTFQEASFYAGVAATDWSWGSLIFDMNNDGLKDIFVSNGIYHDITDLDFVDFLSDEEELKKILKESGRVDFRDFAEYLPHNKQKNFSFVNQDGLKFDNMSAQYGLDQESYSNGSAYGDLDNDGDYDLVVNNANMEAFVYKNNSDNNYIKFKLKGAENNPFGIGSNIKVYYDNLMQTAEVMQARGFQSSVDPNIIFGLGKLNVVDSAVIVWSNQKKQVLINPELNQTLELLEENGEEVYFNDDLASSVFQEVSSSTFLKVPVHQENKYLDFDHERLMPHMLSKEGPKMIWGDVNGDKTEDLILLGSAGQATSLFIGQAGTYIQKNQDFFEFDNEGEDVCGALFDADNDGDLDLMIGEGGNEYQRGIEYFTSRFYYNDGSGNFTRELINAPIASGHIGCIKPCDFDNDGDIDVFVGGRAIPGAYGMTPRSFLFRNDGPGEWKDITKDDTGPIGMVTDAVWVDLNEDDWEDLIVVGEWMPVTVFMNQGTNISQQKTIPNSHGWWNSINPADIDGDGDLDFILGNWGENQKFSASPEKPLRIYVGDYDNNGRTEGILEWYFGEDEKPYPFASKMDLTAQLPILRKNSIKYSEYAEKQVSDMFAPDVLMKSVQKSVKTFKTSILIMDGNELVLQDMPQEAQMSPVFTSVHADLDHDGEKDIFLGGNFHDLKPEVGRHDGFKGGYFKGTGGGQFEFISDVESGLKVQGQVKDVAYKNDQLFIARNNAPILVFKNQ